MRFDSASGLRICRGTDYKTLSTFSLISTSDQTNYLKYPYIAGNVLSAVIPDQAAVWSYPVGCTDLGAPMLHDRAWVAENISDDRIAMNMINSFLGRMHLASHVEMLSKNQLALVQEGVAYYDTLTEAKKNALPYLPLGFTHFGADKVVAGFRSGDKTYLAVWCLGEDKHVEIPLGFSANSVAIAYPSRPAAVCKLDGASLIVDFFHTQAAVFIELK